MLGHGSNTSPINLTAGALTTYCSYASPPNQLICMKTETEENKVPSCRWSSKYCSCFDLWLHFCSEWSCTIATNKLYNAVPVLDIWLHVFHLVLSSGRYGKQVHTWSYVCPVVLGNGNHVGRQVHTINMQGVSHQWCDLFSSTTAQLYATHRKSG